MDRAFSLLISCCRALLACLPLLVGPSAHAAERITVSHTYLLGDADSKNDARQACIREAKRRILEQAGTYSRVITEMREFVITKDVVQSLAAGVIKTTLEQESLSLSGQSTAYTCTVTGEVDLAAMEAQITKLREQLPPPDDSQNSPLDAASPDTPGESASHHTGSSPGAEASPSHHYDKRGPRLPASIPNQPDQGLLQQKLRQREAMQQTMRDTTFFARHLPERGMPYDQVVALVGEPDGGLDGPRFQCRSHGKTWLVYRLGKLACIRRALSWSDPQQSDCHCDGLSTDFHLR